MLVCMSCGEENPARARFCLACAAPLTATAPERRKLATLLFCDLSGSTAMGERVDAESVRDLMFRYFHEMRAAIERHGGTVEKFVGDAVMAVFGVPTAHEDDALRAARAAAEMRERLADLNRELERRFGVTLALRIGVNTGEVVAGDVSTRETLVTGDAVNVAARLEQAAGRNEILLGDLTRRLVRDAVELEPVEPLTLQGKSEPIPAYRLLSVSERATPARTLAASSLVGRADELRALEHAFQDAVDGGRCVIATVAGEPGVGKSRLVAELTETVADRATILRSRCLSYGDGITFFPLGQIVREEAGLRDEHGEEEAVARIAALLGDDPDRARVALHVAAAIGVVDAPTTLPEVAWATRRLVEVLAADRPLVVVVEDVHWAEPALADLLEQLAARTAAPVLLLCSARPELLEGRPQWPITLHLQPLVQDDVSSLLNNLLGHGRLPHETQTRIVAASGGNPLFVEELVATLIEDGTLRRDNGSWLPATDLERLTIPPSIHALLADRLDRLPAAERAVAERASIEGEVFHRGAVMELSEVAARATVRRSLDALAARELVRTAPASFADDAAYRFKHVLVRDAAYGGMPKKLRSELHERFAEWLERTAGAHAAERDEFVGYHLEQAFGYRAELGPVDERTRLLARRAAERLGDAGRRAADRDDARAAQRLLSRAISLADDDAALRAALLPELAEVLVAIGDLQRADEVFSEAIDEARGIGDRGTELSASVSQVLLRLLTVPDTSLDEAVAVGERAVAVLEELGDDRGLARAWRLVATVRSIEFRFGESEAAAACGMTAARRAGDHREAGEIMFLFGVAAWVGPTTAAEGIAKLEDFLPLFEGSPKGEAAVFNAVAALHAMEGRFDEARRLLARTREIYEELGLLLTLWGARMVDGWVELLAGDPVSAERELRPAVEALQEMGEQGYLSMTAIYLAQALAEQGRHDEAGQYLGLAEQAVPPDDAPSQAYLAAVRARLLAARGVLDEAEAVARDAVVAIAKATDSPELRGDSLMTLGEVLALAGRSADAAAAAEEAVGHYEAKGNLVAARRARAFLDQLAAAPTA